MPSWIILLLLVGNMFLLALVLMRITKPSAKAASPNNEDKATEVRIDDETVSDNMEESSEPPQVDIIGKSTLDIEEWRKMIREEIHEVIPLIIKEYGTYADAGWPEPEEESEKVVRKEDFAKVFSNMTMSELTGEPLEADEPRADGIDFNQMDTTVKVLKGKSKKTEDIETAKHVLDQAGNAEIFEVFKLDPVIQKRILMIEYHLPKTDNETADEATSENEDRPKPKKIVYHADIDTEGIDAIDFNIYH